MEASTQQALAVKYQTRQEEAIRTEERLQTMQLDVAKYRLSILMAEQRLLQAQAELGNLYGRVAYLLQEYQRTRLTLVANNPLSRPDFRLLRDGTRAKAEDDFLLAQEWTYLAAKALQYAANGSQKLQNVNAYIPAILSARTGASLETILNSMDAVYFTLQIYQGAPNPEDRRFSLKNDYFQNNSYTYNPDGSINTNGAAFQVQPTGNDSAASAAAWKQFLTNHYVGGALRIPFSTSIYSNVFSPTTGYSQSKWVNPLFFSGAYHDWIVSDNSSANYGVRVNIRYRGPNPAQSPIVEIAQQGASYIRTDKITTTTPAPPVAVWSLRPTLARVTCELNKEQATMTQKNGQLNELSPFNDRWILTVKREGGGVVLLDNFSEITDVEVWFRVSAYAN
jgi:hypothetical protein